MEQKSVEMSKEKQIEEIADILCEAKEHDCKGGNDCLCVKQAEALYNAGYRKQIEGEWIEQIKTTTNANGMTAHYTINFCSECGYEIGTIRYQHKFCPNCGAKMKGGAE